MCSPIGHSLGGMAIGLFRNSGWRSSPWIGVGFVLVLANLPDIDYLFGWISNAAPNLYHRLWTHSLMFMIGIGLLSGIIAQFTGIMNPIRACLMASTIVGSHLLMDVFAKDTSDPQGMLLFWPFSKIFVQSPICVFLDMYKSEYSSDFLQSLWVTHNLKSIFREIVILGPLLIVILLKRKKN